MSFSTIGIHDYNVVFKTCKPFAARWELLATHLNISRESVEEIGRDGHDVADCLQKLLSVWLKRESFDQSLPSWRVLCEAIQELDRTVSERIVAEHQCGCTLCTGEEMEMNQFIV